MFRQIGPTEILLILGVVLLLFGGRKLPELARGSGRALRIFKSEVKTLNDDGDDTDDRDKNRDQVEGTPERERALERTADDAAPRES